MTEYGRFYKTVPMVGTIPENSSGGGGTGLQTVVCGKVAAAGPDRIGGAGGLPCGVVGVATQSDADVLADKSDDYAIGFLSVLLERELYQDGWVIGEDLAERLAEIAVKTVRHPHRVMCLRRRGTLSVGCWT